MLIGRLLHRSLPNRIIVIGCQWYPSNKDTRHDCIETYSSRLELPGRLEQAIFQVNRKIVWGEGTCFNRGSHR
ncbi:hypothetical protein Pdw03_4495 [Penicillium digitatum]|uniref:Uncharacterized protein n=1 Tax=Penicillium digitatum TaxID=36651 RepID=A0A7T7BJ25_PENDI|nr:hypothetical protein Pdw03_4495 [Penicillium digitatum]